MESTLQAAPIDSRDTTSADGRPDSETLGVIPVKLASCEHNRVECICSYVHLPLGSADGARTLEGFSFAVTRPLSFD